MRIKLPIKLKHVSITHVNDCGGMGHCARDQNTTFPQLLGQVQTHG